MHQTLYLRSSCMVHIYRNETPKKDLFKLNAVLGKLDGKEHLSCAHLGCHKRLLKMRKKTFFQPSSLYEKKMVD